MAKPTVEELLSREQLQTYKKLQVLGQEYADEYASGKVKENAGKVRAEVLSGKEPSLPSYLKSTEEQPEQIPQYDVGVPTATTTEEEMGVVYESPFFETERERLARGGADLTEADVSQFYETERDRLEREAKRPVEEDFIFDGDILVGPKPVPSTTVPRLPLEPEPVFLAATPERAKAEPERIKAVEEKVAGVTSVDDASRLQKIYAKFDDTEKKAFLKAKRELINQGASLYEAEARAAQIVKGTISGPREILSAERINAESPELTEDFRISPEFYKDEDVSIIRKFWEAGKPKPLLSPRQVAIAQASEKRGDETRALIEEEVVQDLVAWRNGKKNFKGENYFTYFKDPVRGGIDEDKVKEWKQEHFRTLVKRTEDDIKTSIKRTLLDDLAAKGNVVKPTDPKYTEIDKQSAEIASIWTGDVAPEIATPREGGLIDFVLDVPKAGLAWAMASNQELVWNPKDWSFDVKEIKGAPAFETPLAAGLRFIGGGTRAITEPVAEFLSFEVDNKGNVIDTSDWNYRMSLRAAEAYDKLEKGEAGLGDYLAATFNPVFSTGRNVQGSAPLLSEKKFSGIPATFGLTDGAGYFSEWAFSTATGRWAGTDIAEAPAIKSYWDNVGLPYVPWIAGLAAELLLPISPLTAAGKAASVGGKLAKISKLEKVARGLEETSAIVSQPIRYTASLVGNRVGTIRLYDALLESAGGFPLPARQKVSLFFSPAKLNDAVSEDVARVVSQNVVRNNDFRSGTKPFPEYNNLLYKAKSLDTVYETINKNLNGIEAKLNIPTEAAIDLADAVRTRLVSIIMEQGALQKGTSLYDRATKVVDDVVNSIMTGDRIPEIPENFIEEIIRTQTLPAQRASLIAGDILPDVDRLFANSTFNDWLMITPTTIVKTDAWKRFGPQIDADTKRIIFGSQTDEEIVSTINQEFILLGSQQRADIIDVLEAYKLRSGKTPRYVDNLIGIVKKNAEVSIEDLNKISDTVKSQIASEVIGAATGSKIAGRSQRVVDLTTTGRLAERAAVPIVRRATLARSAETLAKGVFGQVLSRGSRRFMTEAPMFQFLERTPRANIELRNAVEELSAKINALPENSQLGWRRAIINGENPQQLIQREMDEAFNASAYTKEKAVEHLTGIIKRFFSIGDEQKLFKENYEIVVDRIVTRMINDNRFGEVLDSGLLERGLTLDIIGETIRSVKSYFSNLENKGLSTKFINFGDKVDDEAILSLVITQILDAKRLALIDDFGKKLAANYPELIVGDKTFLPTERAILNVENLTIDAADGIEILRGEATELGKTADDLIGNPKISNGPDGTKIVVREFLKRPDDYVADLMEISKPIIVDAVLAANTTKMNSVIADVYQAVIRNASIDGKVSLEELNVRIGEKLTAKFNVDSIISSVRKTLKETYPDVHFDDVTIRTEEKTVKFSALEPARQHTIIQDIIRNPVVYSAKADDVTKIEELKRTIVSKTSGEPSVAEWEDAIEAAVRNDPALSWVDREYNLALTLPTVARTEKLNGLKVYLDGYLPNRFMKPEVVEAQDKLNTIATRIAKTNVMEVASVSNINKSGMFIPELEAGIRAFFMEELYKNINANAVDLVSKLQYTGIPIDVVRGEMNFNDVMIKAKQLGDVSVLVDDDTYQILTSLTSNNIYVERGLERLAVRNLDGAAYLGSKLIDVIDGVRMRTVQGMLGGYIAPNTRFFAVNNFGAPLIAAVTNPTYVGTVLKTIPAAFGKATMEATRAVGLPRTVAGSALAGATMATTFAGFGIPTLIGALAGTGAGLALTKVGAKSAYGFSDFAPIVTPAGKVITSVEFNNILGRNKWKIGQIDFEFSDRMLSEVVDAFKGTRPEIAKGTIQHLVTLSNNKNFWNAIGSEADISFRRAVFKEALARGLNEGQAANLSRNTLLDYTAISETERKTIARGILFYAFARQSLVETLSSFIREPVENAIVKKVIVQRAVADLAAKEYGVELEDYQRSRLFLAPLAGKKDYDGKDVLFFGIDDPMLSQFNSFISTFGLINSYDYINKTDSGYVKAAIDWYAGKRPELAVLQDQYELERSKNDGYFGMVPATDLVVLQQIGAIDSVISTYDLQPITQVEIEKLKEKYGGLPTWLAGKPTYNGQYYKFGTKEGASRFITSKYVATIAGFQRGIQDWAQLSAKTEGIKNPELKRYKDGRWYLYGLGLETPMEAPDWLQIQYEFAQRELKDLQQIKEGKNIKRITTEGE